MYIDVRLIFSVSSHLLLKFSSQGQTFKYVTDCFRYLYPVQTSSMFNKGMINCVIHAEAERHISSFAVYSRKKNSTVNGKK